MQPIKNITVSDINEMLTVASPDEVYTFITTNLKNPTPIRLKWIAHQTKTILTTTICKTSLKLQKSSTHMLSNVSRLSTHHNLEKLT